MKIESILNQTKSQKKRKSTFVFAFCLERLGLEVGVCDKGGVYSAWKREL